MILLLMKFNPSLSEKINMVVAQQAEVSSLNLVQCGFESRSPHTRRHDEMEAMHVLETCSLRECGFKSRCRY